MQILRKDFQRYVAITSLGLEGRVGLGWARPPRKPRCHLISCRPTSAHANHCFYIEHWTLQMPHPMSPHICTCYLPVRFPLFLHCTCSNISMGWFCFLHFHSTKTWIGRYSAFSPPLSMALAFVKSREKSISRPTDGSTPVYNVNTFLYYTSYIGPPTDGSNEIAYDRNPFKSFTFLFILYFDRLIGWKRAGLTRFHLYLKQRWKSYKPLQHFLT